MNATAEVTRSLCNTADFFDGIYILSDGLNPREICILASIAYGTFARKPFSVGTLSDKYDWPMSTVSRSVGALIESHLVCETIDLDDRRKKSLALTNAGAEIYNKLCKRISNL